MIKDKSALEVQAIIERQWIVMQQVRLSRMTARDLVRDHIFFIAKKLMIYML